MFLARGTFGGFIFLFTLTFSDSAGSPKPLRGRDKPAPSHPSLLCGSTSLCTFQMSISMQGIGPGAQEGHKSVGYIYPALEFITKLRPVLSPQQLPTKNGPKYLKACCRDPEAVWLPRGTFGFCICPITPQILIFTVWLSMCHYHQS